METDEQRLAKTKEYVTTLLNKERYMKWNARTVLLAIRECLQQGMDIIPPEDKQELGYGRERRKNCNKKAN